MKTAFKAKIIFESDYLEVHEGQGNPPLSETQFNLLKMKSIINGQKVNIECILDSFTNDFEPVIILKQTESL